MKTYRIGWHVLDEQKNVVPIADDDREALAKYERPENRRVAFDRVGGKTVSTVFSMFNLSPVGRPTFFETAVFGGRFQIDKQERYATWAEAQEGHKRIVREIAEGLPS